MLDADVQLSDADDFQPSYFSLTELDKITMTVRVQEVPHVHRRNQDVSDQELLAPHSPPVPHVFYPWSLSLTPRSGMVAKCHQGH